MRVLTLLDPITRPLLLLLVTVVDGLLTPIQRRVGVDKMGYFSSCPT